MKTRIGVSLLLAILLGAFCLLTPHVSAGGSGASDAHCHPRTYRIGDLPVWTKDGQFQPKVLLWHIQSTVSPKSWEASGGQSTMALYPPNGSVVISTTPDIHEQLHELLEKLR